MEGRRNEIWLALEIAYLKRNRFRLTGLELLGHPPHCVGPVDVINYK